MAARKRILHLPVKAKYFHQMKDGIKRYEYRLKTDYWLKRLEGREYDEVHIKLGYPAADDQERILVRPWRGYEMKIIEHEHFGEGEKSVYAIRVN
jgi:hypothetical protein